MIDKKTAIQKLEYLIKASWLIPGDTENELNLEMLQLTLPIINSPKNWYSIDEAYEIQIKLEKESSH